ncbi:hypothetical protein SAY87_028341 [Trapa incisa]|uniref:cyclin-dependent kinase n=1 Tax=Trapa incisa TaxID=236973 RepID=A0AAN7KTT7_9MYRT|nr:hypothetical protein SAY87_028341 [Trapa incisa]
MATGKVSISRRWNYQSPSRRVNDRHHYEVRQSVAHRVTSSGHQEFEKGSKQLQHEKKRKISSVKRGCEEKKAKKFPRYTEKENKVLPEKRAISASIISAIIETQSGSSSDISDGSFAAKSPASPKQDNESNFLDLSAQEHDEKDDLEQSTLEDGELVEERNISMSRWVTDDVSPGNMDLSVAVGVFDQNDDSSMSPLSGEFQIGLSGPQPGSTEESGSSSRADSIGQEAVKELQILEYQDTDVILDKCFNQSELQSDEESDVKKTLSSTGGSVSMLSSCRSVFEYERLNRISEGTYGVVFRAKDKKTGEIVALKKVKMNKEDPDMGFPLSALREINILLSINHPSIVTVKEVVMGDLDNVFMVMEYMEHDLKALMEMRKRPFSTSEIKCLMLQLLDGVKYLHDNWVLHRDLKTSNLLMNNEGELKICDLGLSRHYASPLKPYTPLVVTMWYRAPELLLGCKEYSTAIDMWSVGCIMAELLANEPLFKGSNEVNQLDKIFRTLGTPNEKIWPEFPNFPGAKANFVKQPYNLLRKKFPATSFTGSTVLSESGFDLLNRLLTYDPEKRITAHEALNHRWFQEVPLPTCKELMPTFPPRHAGGC